MYAHGFVVKSSGLLLKASLESNASLTSKSTHRHCPAAMSSISPRSGSPQASGSTRRLSDSSQDVSSRVAPSAVSHIPRVGIVFAGAADLTSPGGLAKKICATEISVPLGAYKHLGSKTRVRGPRSSDR